MCNKLRYRLICHLVYGRITITSAPTSLQRANRVLDHLVHRRVASGGHIEESISGIGWCVYPAATPNEHLPPKTTSTASLPDEVDSVL